MISVGRNTPSTGETFGEIFRPLRQIDCPNMGRKFGIFNFRYVRAQWVREQGGSRTLCLKQYMPDALYD